MFGARERWRWLGTAAGLSLRTRKSASTYPVLARLRLKQLNFPQSLEDSRHIYAGNAQSHIKIATTNFNEDAPCLNITVGLTSNDLLT